MKDANGKSRCFGFVNFENPDDASAACENLNGSSINDKVLYVGKAEKKAERETKLRAKFEQERNSRFEKLKGANLYLKNLDESINDEKVKELFSEFGTITSCKLMRDQNGVSKGTGFVAFSTPEEANKALNGKMIEGKPLYAAIAQRKEERKSWLQAHFAQMRTPGTMSPLHGMPGFHSGASSLAHQQLFFGQVGAGLVSSQAPPTYGFQQQHMTMHGVPSNFVMPFQLQRQGHAPRRGASPQHQQQQRNSNQGVNRYIANGRSPSTIPQGLMGPMIQLPLDASATPISRSTFVASALASASPENQRLMLGEQLYPLVERIERNNAGKVTGMLLEMDQTEVLHLLESPDALKKVSEAMDRILTLLISYALLVLS